MSSFCLDAALPLMCSTCAFTVLVAALWCGWLHHLWFHSISAACGGHYCWGCGSGVGLRRKPLAACWPIMATSLGAVFLLGGIIQLSLPPSTSLGTIFLLGGIIQFPLPPLCPHGWSLGQWFILCTCIALFPHCRLGCLGRGG